MYRIKAYLGKLFPFDASSRTDDSFLLIDSCVKNEYKLDIECVDVTNEKK